MPFQPRANDTLVIDHTEYRFVEHPIAKGLPFGQEGRAAIVYQLDSDQGKRALKVFKARFRRPSLVALSDRIAPFAQLKGLRVCFRSVLTARRHGELLREFPDLTYAVVMPWINGPTWAEVLLEGQALSPAESLRIAATLAEILAGMEEQGLAHCDLSGPNVIIPALGTGYSPDENAAVELVDVEQMYGPGLEKQEVLLSGSPGYAAKNAEAGELWGSRADRFAGAMLLGEMLGWCDETVRAASWGETYFDPDEVQDAGSRNYRMLIDALERHWGSRVADLFAAAWRSDTLVDCPTFGEWLIKLPRQAPAAQPDLTAQGDVLSLVEAARRLEIQGDPVAALEAYRQAQQVAPVGSGLAQELSLIVASLQAQLPESTTTGPTPGPTAAQQPESELDRLFSFALVAYSRGDWRGAQEVLREVVRTRPDYARDGRQAAALLAEVDRRVAEQDSATATPPVPVQVAAVAPATIISQPPLEQAAPQAEPVTVEGDTSRVRASQPTPVPRAGVAAPGRLDSRLLMVGGIVGALVVALLLAGFFLFQNRPAGTSQANTGPSATVQGGVAEGTQPPTAEGEPAPTEVAGAEPTGVAPAGEGEVAIRVNQVGYLPSEVKRGLVLSRIDLSGQTFSVVRDGAGDDPFEAGVGADRGGYGNFQYVYEVDFTFVTTPGSYHVELVGVESPDFIIDEQVYAPLLPVSLNFFRVQRCGDTDPEGHGVCHVLDGEARGGPLDGIDIGVSGGWHDAGDYLKFVSSTGAATDMMLVAYQRHPEAFAGDVSDGVPNLLAEARIGLDWLYKMWDPTNGVLYYQVGDASGDDDWRLPEDDQRPQPRPVWASEPGKGANLAGKMAAAFALAATIWNDPAQSYYDPELAQRYLTAARQLYDFGVANPESQSATDGFYNEESWTDDMALGAAELYRATSESDYLAAARAYVAEAGQAYNFNWSVMQALAHYEIARLDPTYVDTAIAYLENDLQAYASSAAANPFQVGLSELFRGSAPVMMGIAIEEMFYQDLGGSATYRSVGQAQRDYLLGANPWGVCMVSDVGTTWPRQPHHQVADLQQIQLEGAWGSGPASLSAWQEQKIELSSPDIYEDFQSDFSVYHDDVADYVTNEPTILANAWGIMLASWYVP